MSSHLRTNLTPDVLEATSGKREKLLSDKNENNSFIKDSDLPFLFYKKDKILIEWDQLIQRQVRPQKNFRIDNKNQLSIYKLPNNLHPSSYFENVIRKSTQHTLNDKIFNNQLNNLSVDFVCRFVFLELQ